MPWGALPCLATGTLIDTPTGPRPVEGLRKGDPVLTCDHPVPPVLWSAQRHLDASALDRRPQDRPVHFARHSIGNQRPLRLSPQHAVALGDALLVRARHLVGLVPGVHIAQGARQITHHHLLLPPHSDRGQGAPAPDTTAPHSGQFLTHSAAESRK